MLVILAMRFLLMPPPSPCMVTAVRCDQATYDVDKAQPSKTQTQKRRI